MPTSRCTRIQSDTTDQSHSKVAKWTQYVTPDFGHPKCGNEPCSTRWHCSAFVYYVVSCGRNGFFRQHDYVVVSYSSFYAFDDLLNVVFPRSPVSRVQRKNPVFGHAYRVVFQKFNVHVYSFRNSSLIFVMLQSFGFIFPSVQYPNSTHVGPQFSNRAGVASFACFSISVAACLISH
jgi:hypothetical protein